MNFMINILLFGQQQNKQYSILYMSVRYQFIKNPKTTIYETPAQAYLIINGIAQSYKVTKYSRKRNAGSLSCHHRPQSSRQKKCCQLHGCSQTRNSANKYRTQRMQSCNKAQKKCRGRMTQQQYKQTQNCASESVYKQKQDKSKANGFSFRDLNLAQQKKVNCNYPKHLEKQNIDLRKQNKFLQQYVKMLENKYRDTNQSSSQKAESKFRRSSGSNSGQKNAFNLKNYVDSSERNSETGQFYSNNMQSTKGQSQWQSYHS